VLLASCSGDIEERKNCYSITADDTNHDFRDIWNFASGKIVTFLLSVLLVAALKNGSRNKSFLRVKRVSLSFY